MRRKVLAVLLTGVITTGLLAGCGSTGQSAEEKVKADVSVSADEIAFTGAGLNESKKIILGYQAGFGLYELDSKTHFIEDFFTAEGIEVEWELFTYGPPMMEALAAGDINIATGLGAAPAITSFANGSEIEFIYQQAADFSSVGLLVREDSGINSLEDLKGKKVASAVGSAAFISFLQGLEFHDLSEADIEVVNLAAADSLTPLVSGEVDAVATWEPFTSQFANQDDIKDLWRINDDNVISPNVIAANTNFAHENPEIVAKYLQIFRQFEKDTLDNPQPAIDALVEATGNPEDTYVSFTRWETYEPFNEEQIDSLIYNIDYLYNNDLIENNFDVNDAINKAYYLEALKLEEQ